MSATKTTRSDAAFAAAAAEIQAALAAWRKQHYAAMPQPKGARTALFARIRGGKETRGQGCPRCGKILANLRDSE
jgi:hypothetical protein